MLVTFLHKTYFLDESLSAEEVAVWLDSITGGAMAEAPLYEIAEVRDQLEKWLIVTRSRQSDEQADPAKHC